jgi:hypothetical protein
VSAPESLRTAPFVCEMGLFEAVLSADACGSGERMNQFHHPKLHRIETYLACDNQRLKASSDLFLPFRGFHNDTIHHDIREYQRCLYSL